MVSRRARAAHCSDRSHLAALTLTQPALAQDATTAEPPVTDEAAPPADAQTTDAERPPRATPRSSSPPGAARSSCSTCRSRSPLIRASSSSTQGALDITDIGDTTPNVTLEASRGTNSTLTAFIRGVGQQDPVAGFEQGVGIYLDDVYLNRPQARPARHLRCRADRGAARAAGHALRPQHDRRRDQICHPPDAGDPEAAASAPRSAPTSRPTWSSAPARRSPTTLPRRRLGRAASRATASARTSPPACDNYNRDIWAGARPVEVNNDRQRLRPAAGRPHPGQ